MKNSQNRKTLFSHSVFASLFFVFVTGALFMTLTGCEIASSPSDDPSLTDEEIEAKVAEGIEKYIEGNQVKFGKQVLDSTSAFHADQLMNPSIQELAKNVPAMQEDEYVLGNKDADIVLFTYTEYYYPFARRFHSTLHNLVKEDTRVALVLRPMPILQADTGTPMHEIAECVGKYEGSDAFWLISDVLFAKKAEGVTPDTYKEELKRLKFKNIKNVVSCYEKGEMKEKVQKSVLEGRSLGVEKTPTTIVKNKKTGKISVIEGSIPLVELKKTIRSLL